MSRQQQQVWNGVKQAIKTLKAARDLEITIEEERVRNAVEAGRLSGFFPSEGALAHDPLGRKLDQVIEKLEELL